MEVPPDAGGNPGDVVIVFQHQGEQLLGGTELQRVVEVGCLTRPSDVFFQFRLPATGYTRAAGAAYAEGFAIAIEDFLLTPPIVGVGYFQDLSPAGQLLDKLDLYWQSADGTADGVVPVLMSSLTEDQALAAVRAAMAPFV